MDIETQDPSGVKDPPLGAPAGNVVVPMQGARRSFSPNGFSNRNTRQSAVARLPSAAPAKRAGPSLPYLFSEEVMAVGLDGAQLSIRETGNDSPCLMHAWAKTHWTRVGENKGAAAADAWLRANAPDKLTPHLAKQCWDSAKLVLLQKRPFPERSLTEIRIPTRTHTLCVLDDGKILAVPPNPAFGLEHCLAIKLPLPPEGGEYVPEVVGPGSNTRFSNWLMHAMPDASERIVLQELCGQTLMPKAYGIAGWLVGEAGSGKSTVLEMLSLVHSNAVRMFLHKLDGEFALAPLLDASVVLLDEAKPGRFDEQMLKTLVSQNTLSIARKHLPTIGEFRPPGKLMLGSNQMPVVHDTSEGVWRRLIFMHFRHVVPELDRKPEVAREFDLREVLDWMLEGVVRIAQRGRMLVHAELPASCRAMKDGAKLSSDNVLSWMEGDGVQYDERAEPDWVSCQAIYDRYFAFCQGVGDPISPNAFWRTMRERLRGKGVTLAEPSNRRLSGGKPVRCQPFVFGVTKTAAEVVKPAIPDASLLFDAIEHLDLAAAKKLTAQGVSIDARRESRSALGLALNHPGNDEEVMPIVRWLLDAGAQVQRAGSLTTAGVARLMAALVEGSNRTAQAERDASQVLDDVLGRTSIPDTYHCTSPKGARS